jgi:hypothetical protein
LNPNSLEKIKASHHIIRLFYCIVFGLFLNTLNAQTAIIEGIIFDESNNVIPFVNIKAGKLGTTTNKNGFYRLIIPSNQEVEVLVSHIGFKKISATINLESNQKEELNFVLKVNVEQIGEVTITKEKQTRIEGILTLEPATVRRIPGANPGVENLLTSLPGVSSNNELSTQYNVRGGNFDENLVYVNDIEVYRPFLIRSGQQEGLSFVNPDMVRDIKFSAGGFKAQYGDRMSSVLDITYERPVSFMASFDASFLGGSAMVGGISKNKKFNAITGVRYRDNSLFVNAKDTQANFRPRFFDVQNFMTYKFNDKFELGFLGNIAINDYQYRPFARQTNFGTLQDPRALLVIYDGQEDSEYETYFGALKATYDVTDNYTAKFIASAYHTQEQEHFDILAQYRLGAVNSSIGDENFGEVEFSQGAGAQFKHARNNLDALIINLNHQGDLKINKHLIKYGLKYTHEDIRDRLREYEVVDSAGFNVRPPSPDFVNDEPYNPNDSPIEPFIRIRSFNQMQINRFTNYVQWSYQNTLGNAKVWYNAGFRTHTWQVSGEGLETTTQTVFSPRAQFALKPEWEKDMIFRIAGGLYHQPPFYRELRRPDGTVNENVKAQQSFHLVAGHDYSFKMWGRPFKLVSEVYFKDLQDVNRFTVENVRIRYQANNIAEAYAYGLDMRLNGEFVPGTESWFSFGYLKTEEKFDERGFIARPTDQRLKFAALFQDYIPRIPKMKLYLNLVYNTGLPGGQPQFEDPFDFQNRLPDYTRVDVGFFYNLVDEEDEFQKGHWLSPFKNLELGFEIFNMFDRLNSITNTFVRDAESKLQFAIPDFLSPRVFNLRIRGRF